MRLAVLHRAVAALIAAFALPVAAQTPAVAGTLLVGRVVSEADSAPVPDAEVLVARQSRTVRTDSTGAFRLAGLPAGTHRVVVRRLGFLAVGADVALGVSDTVQRVVRLRVLPQRLPGVAVVDKVTARRLERFEERRAFGQGHFLTPEDMERDRGLPFSAVVRKRLPGFNLVLNPRNGRAYAASSRVFSGAPARRADPFDPRSPSGCFSQIILDGLRIYPSGTGASNGMPAPELDSFSSLNVIAVEAYTTTTTPVELEGPAAGCGTLVLWTGASAP
jgi:Carboxypeptidase regulatory-like domain